MKPKDEKPNATARAKLIAFLEQAGFKRSEIVAIIKAGRTREELTHDLIALQQKSPRGKV